MKWVTPLERNTLKRDTSHLMKGATSMTQHLSSISRILIIAVIAIIPPLANGSTLAAPPADIPVRTVETWLHHVDTLQDAACWKEASQFLQHNIPPQEWERILKSIRAPIGTVIVRRHMVTQYTTRLPGILDGTYAILQFDSKFTGQDSAIETVVFSKESDGQWRAIGYSMK
jgi:hypothetical protein